MRIATRSVLSLALVLAAVATCGTARAATLPPKVPEAVGRGGAVASMDADATAAGIEVLRRGGNAVDAAVATAAALGVTAPYYSGIGGGGYFVHYDARSHQVVTLDGRERAPLADDSALFLEHGKPLPLADAITSGLSVGVPGTLATWQRALDRWGSRPLGELLKPAERIADRGFVVNRTFHDQTVQNQDRFKDFPATRRLFLPGGRPPEVGSVLRNPDLAATYREIGRDGVAAFYQGDIGRDLAATVQHPPVDPASTRVVRPGKLATGDLAEYAVRPQDPTHVEYHGYDVYSAPPSSSGGTAVGEALDLLRDSGDLSKVDSVQYYHRFIEASRIAFADRDRWMGDPAFTPVPTSQLLSERYADSRACLIDPDRAGTSPLAPGDPYHPGHCPQAGGPAVQEGREGPNTTHLTVADRWGDVVSYTLTIEQTGGSAITVPGRGFLLNNQLTDFDFVPSTPGVPDPNLPAGGKRPRSAIAPTIVLRDGTMAFATGSPGGATIITTVLRVLLGRIDRGLSLERAIAAPRASQRNLAATEAEPAFLALPELRGLEALGQRFTPNPEIGAATGVERLPDGRWLAAAEPVRRGGGAAAVVVRPDH
jgi:gamma-glutamyltranspeptidase/glutathione hydrolase